MPFQRRPIPESPDSPRTEPIPGILGRSYPVGRQEFSRAFAERQLELSIYVNSDCPPDVHADLVTTINADRPGEWVEIPFERSTPDAFVCRIIPDAPGLYTFRAHFGMSRAMTLRPDAVPDAWLLVDPPQVDDLRLYTMIPTVSGTISDWKQDLKRIKDIGFNAIHLLPLTALDDSQSPYSARDLFEIDQSYVTPELGTDGLTQLDDYVEEAKRLGIRLCFDLVPNHIGVNSTIARCAPEWITPDPQSPDGMKRARYWSEQGLLLWHDLVLINYEHPSEQIRSQIWSYMTEYALFWAKYADYTGGFIRFDNLHSSDHNFIRSVTSALNAEYPNLGIIAEYFTDDATLLETIPLWRLNLILATPWNYRFVPQLRDYLKYLHRLSEHVRFLIPITSHDSGSPAQEFATSQSTVPRYVASALLGTGATGITQGVEWGAETKIEFIGRHGKMPRPADSPYAGLICRVNQILTEHAAFRCGGNCQFIDSDHHAIIAAYRPNTYGPGFIVVCNFDIALPQTLDVDLSHVLTVQNNAICTDLLTGSKRSLIGGRLTMVLPPCGAEVLMFTDDQVEHAPEPYT